MISKHPFEPFIPVGATKLIIGTIPPPRFCKEPYQLHDDDVNFYYGSRDNSFWPLLEEIFNEKLDYQNNASTIDQRKQLLDKLGIGITDIIADCTHANDSAEDRHLNVIKHKDLEILLRDNPGINTLIYTSEFVKKLVNEYFKTYHLIDPINRKKQTIKINGKVFQVRILYSPSPLALRGLGENGDTKRKEQYRDFLMKE